MGASCLERVGVVTWMPLFASMGPEIIMAAEVSSALKPPCSQSLALDPPTMTPGMVSMMMEGARGSVSEIPSIETLYPIA